MPEHDSDMESQLHERASAMAEGLKDFGDDSYRTGLRLLLREQATRATEDGGVVLPDAITEVLMSRLYSQAGWQQTPQCLADRIVAPIVIAGMPRTGTTLLHRLLAADPQLQGLPGWLLRTPMIRPPRMTWPAHPNFTAIARRFQLLDEKAPDLRAKHENSAEQFDECMWLLAQTFVSPMFGLIADVPGYDAWCMAADLQPTYRRFADNLKLIGHAEPQRRWLLKAPIHTLYLEALLQVFPDACIVQIHRDPVVALASNASLAHTLRGGSQQDSNVGPRNSAIWSEAVKRSMAAQDRWPERFHDVDYRAFVRAPIEAVQEIYARFGLELKRSVKNSMCDWLARHPQGRHGEHRYSPEQFGLSERAIRATFAGYMERHHL